MNWLLICTLFWSPSLGTAWFIPPHIEALFADLMKTEYDPLPVDFAQEFKAMFRDFARHDENIEGAFNFWNRPPLLRYFVDLMFIASAMDESDIRAWGEENGIPISSSNSTTEDGQLGDLSEPTEDSSDGDVLRKEISNEIIKLMESGVTSDSDSQREINDGDSSDVTISIPQIEQFIEDLTTESIEDLSTEQSIEDLSTEQFIEDLSTEQSIEDLSTGESIEVLSTGESIEDLSTEQSIEDLSTGESNDDLSTGESIEDLSTGESYSEDESGSRKSISKREISDAVRKLVTSETIRRRPSVSGTNDQKIEPGRWSSLRKKKIFDVVNRLVKASSLKKRNARQTIPNEALSQKDDDDNPMEHSTDDKTFNNLTMDAERSDDENSNAEEESMAKHHGQKNLLYEGSCDFPSTSFTCTDQPHVPGFYADLEAGCQVFHVCWQERHESFLCPIGTLFNQEVLACDDWYNTNCSNSHLFFQQNADQKTMGDFDWLKLEKYLPIRSKVHTLFNGTVSATKRTPHDYLQKLSNPNSSETFQELVRKSKAVLRSLQKIGQILLEGISAETIILLMRNHSKMAMRNLS